MKQIIALVFFDILSYTIGNIILCMFKFNNYNRKGIQTSACRSLFPCLFSDEHIPLSFKSNVKSDEITHAKFKVYFKIKTKY